MTFWKSMIDNEETFKFKVFINFQKLNGTFFIKQNCFIEEIK